MQMRNANPSEIPVTKSISRMIPSRDGILTLSGYGIDARIDRGHLLLEDGIGANRREGRFARIGHGIRRLVVIGADGMISLAALRWLADQKASFVMLDRDGSVLAVTGPVRPSDSKLRRAQALAHDSGAAVLIAKELVRKKLIGQEAVARNRLRDIAVGDDIARLIETLNQVETLDDVRPIEAQAASVYWSAWADVPVMFPKNDLRRVPEHWRVFRNRHSPLTGSCRLAANPVNAMLNYLYAVLESETFLAVAALGLDPGLAFMHTDTRNRDSLACDVMEPIRPQIDAFVLNWINTTPLKREWFFEQRDGSCRLTSALASQLSDTAPTWQRAIGPLAEWVAQTLWSMIPKQDSQPNYPTRLTQRSKRRVRAEVTDIQKKPISRRANLCRGCGVQIGHEHRNCSKCAVSGSTDRILEAAKAGRVAAHTPKAQAKRSETQRRNAEARHKWVPSSQPAWLTAEVFSQRIQPLLAEKSNSAIAAVLGVSLYYAADIRRGRSRPHPRHWQSLAELVAGCQ